MTVDQRQPTPAWAAALVFIGGALLIIALLAWAWLLPGKGGDPIFIQPPASPPAVPQPHPTPGPPAQPESE